MKRVGKYSVLFDNVYLKETAIVGGKFEKEGPMQEYFDKLCNILGNEYKLNYYEVDTDDDLKDISFSSDIEAEKIIRLICIKNDKNYKKQNLRLGVITIDLSDIKDKNGNSLYKEVLVKAKEVYKNELCSI